MFPDTLEIESLLNSAFHIDAAAIDQAINAVDAFVADIHRDCLNMLREDQVLDQADEIRAVFAAVVGETDMKMGFISRTKLLAAGRSETMEVYEIARRNSLSRRLNDRDENRDLRQKMPTRIVPHGINDTTIDLARSVQTCFNANGLSEVLRQKFGVSFAKVLEKDFISAWVYFLAHRCLGDQAYGQSLLDLIAQLRRAPSIGWQNNGSNIWLCFVE
jgi:hypothetical protein